jgi:hypothetical protein
MSLQEELTERLAQGLRERLARFEPRVLSWLLLLPEWTATQWPFGDDLIGRFEASGLIEQRETFDGGVAFWVRDSVRPELARYVRETRGSRLEADVAELARSTSLGTLIRYRDDPSGQSLMDDVEALIRDGKLGEATRLTAQARLLGEALNEPLADAARRARWLIDRAVRTAEDQRRLQHYVHRSGIEEAFRALLDEEFPYYVLHLLGDGGTGKTMAIRQLCNTAGIHVARIDFDYLDPRYPDQRPGEILLALAGELLGYGTTRGMYYGYRRLRDAVDAVHEELASEVYATRPAFTEMIRAFADFVASFRPPVLFVLDTCEELAKLYLPGAEAPAIDQTFRIIEMVHARNPFVRFVLAGRRWLVPPSSPVSAAAGPALRPRPYVSVEPVSGFTRAEALTYVQVRQLRSEAMIEALLRRAAMPDGTCNPFELASYCEWAVSDPDLDPAELTAAPGDPLVERRIVGRTGDGIRPALPIAAALGRFDLDLIASALGCAGLDPATAFRELSGQEWVNVLSVDASGQPREIEVDEHLRDRILRVTAARHPVDHQALGRDAAAAIERSGELSATPVSTVEAAVRLLPPAEAGEFWARLEQRIADQDAWAWAAQATTRVGAIEAERAEGEGPTILAAILATQAAARLRTGGDVIPLWREARRYAARHPDPEQAHKLSVREMLGRLAAGDPNVDPESIPSTPRGDLAAAYLAAAQRLVADGRDAGGLAWNARLSTDDPRIKALATSLQAVLALWADEGFHAADLARDAESLAAGAGPVTSWADWVPPRRILDRCRLTQLFVAFVTGDQPPGWESWRDEAIEHLDDIDAERLVSLSLRFEAGFRPVPPGEIWRIRAEESYAPRRRTDWLHFQVRPLIAELATQIWTDRNGSLQMLGGRIDEAVAAGDDPDIIDACQLAQMRICRRRREMDGRVLTLSREGSPLARAEAWLVRTLVDGDRPKPEPSVPEAPHSFDPEDILRAGGSIDAMPPGERGRAMLAVAEVRALRSPAPAAELLRAAVGPLREAGDYASAAQAAVLRILAHVRAYSPGTVPFDALPNDREAGALPSTWATRLDVARRLDAGESPPFDIPDRSPELPSLAPARYCENCGSPMEPYDAFCGTCGRPAGLTRASQAPGQSPPQAYAAASAPPQPFAVASAAIPDAAIARVASRWRRGLRLEYAHSRVTVTRSARLLSWRLVRYQTVRLSSLDEAPPIPALRVGRKRPAICKIETDPELDDYPWEQWLGAGYPERGPADLLYFRVGEGGPRFMRWDRHSYAYLGPAHILGVAAGTGKDWALHLIGTPVNTKGGWRLRVTGTGYPTRTSRGTDEGESLFSPLSLEQTPPVVVLQADPVDGDPRPLGVDRKGFIRLARECLADGGEAVFVVPPLGDALARTTARSMRDAIMEMPASLRPADLLDLLAHVKRLVRTHDVLLFLNERML